MNPLMYGEFEMVEHKVQIFHKYFMIFTHTYQANCVRCPDPLMVQDTERCGILLRF